MSALLETCDEHPACEIREPTIPLIPLVIASPHSGNAYSAEFLAASRLELATLRRSEDSFVDELFADAPALGAPLLAALFPRAFCDVNRERWELDPDMFADALPDFCNTSSRRVAAGFGTIARVVSNGSSIYKRKLRFEEAKVRVETYWEPYHAALRSLLARALAQFGRCLLIDCHSMPDEPASRSRAPASFVLGDAHGSACAPEIVRFIERHLESGGHLVRRNDPYAGGYITREYGRPREGVHVLQLEIARRLYMDEQTRRKRDGFGPLQGELSRLLGQLAKLVTGWTDTGDWPAGS